MSMCYYILLQGKEANNTPSRKKVYIEYVHRPSCIQHERVYKKRNVSTERYSHFTIGKSNQVNNNSSGNQNRQNIPRMRMKTRQGRKT